MAFYIKIKILNKYKFKKTTADKILNIDINKLESLKELPIKIFQIIIVRYLQYFQYKIRQYTKQFIIKSYLIEEVYQAVVLKIG